MTAIPLHARGLKRALDPMLAPAARASRRDFTTALASTHDAVTLCAELHGADLDTRIDALTRALACAIAGELHGEAARQRAEQACITLFQAVEIIDAAAPGARAKQETHPHGN